MADGVSGGNGSVSAVLDPMLNDIKPAGPASPNRNRPNRNRPIAKPAQIAKSNEDGLNIKPRPDAFIFVMRGDVYTAAGEQRDLKPYKNVVCVVPESIIKRAMSYIKSVILPKLLARLIPGFISVRTYHIQKVIPPTPQKALLLPLDLMDRDMLTKYIEHNQLKVDPKYYSRAVDLKKAIMDCEENEEFYLKNEGKVMAESDLLASLDQLNGIDEAE